MTGADRWRIEVSREASRSFRQLPPRVAAAIAAFVAGPLAESPLRLSKPLHDELAAYRSARRGDYRVLIRVDHEEHAILVVRVGHRAHIYRRRT